MGTELAEGGVVHLAVERDVVLDLRAAVDAVQDVALQVLVYGVVLLQAVQRDAVERQRVGDLLSRRNHFGQKLVSDLYWRRKHLDIFDESLHTYNDSCTGQKYSITFFE